MFLSGMGRKPSVTRDVLLCLGRYFARLCYHKKISQNPASLIDATRFFAKVNIVSESDFTKLLNYIKDRSSPPEEALVLVLVLFFGLKTIDLTHATIEITSNDEFHLILPRTPRSYGRRHYHREQLLKLPNQPIWLCELKRRFLSFWKDTFTPG